MAESAIQTKRKKSTKSVASTKPVQNSPSISAVHNSASRAFYATGPAFSLSSPVQAKVTIGKADDSYEREADNVAEHVVRGEKAPAVSAIPAAGLNNVARLEDKQNVEDMPAQRQVLQRLPDEAEDSSVQSKAVQRMQDETEDSSVQSKAVQRMTDEAEDSSVQSKAVQRTADETEESSVQSKAVQCMADEAEESNVQSKAVQRVPDETEDNSVQSKAVQRMADEGEESSVQSKTVQRMADEAEESNVQSKAVQRMEDEEPVQARQATGNVAKQSSMQAAASNAINHSSAGEPLNEPLRNTMESSMGVGLGDVRVHDDQSSHQSTHDLKARAFTNKNHIWLGRGESQSDVRLMAHETTHVLQQTGTVQRQLIQRESAEPQVTDDKTPTEAEKAAALAAAEAAEILAAQTAATGREQVAKSVTDKIAEKEAGKVAQEQVVLAEGEATVAAEPQGDAETNTEAVIEEKKPEQEEQEAKAPAAKAAKGGSGVAAKGANDSAPKSANEDPGYKAVLAKVKGVASKQRKHEPAKEKADAAQDAAESPQSELDGKAQDKQVGAMQDAETPAFDAVAFKAQLMDRIKALAPKTVEDADNFKKNDKLGALKGDMQSSVAEQKTASQTPMAEQAAAVPDSGSVEAKPVTPLEAANAGEVPGNVGAQQAAPKSKGQSELETPLSESNAQVETTMQEADVDEQQLQQANEPEFQGAVDAKSEATTHTEQGPLQYREFEQGQIKQAEQVAAATASDRTQGMHAERGGVFTQVEGQQGVTKTKDEQQRDKIAGDISKIYEKTKTNVETRLSELDGKVAKVFDEGAAAAKQAFENYVEAKMDAYKEKRYGGMFGWARWGKDKLLGMPSAVNAFYSDGRQLYLDKMDAVIDNVVALVGTELTEAKAEIATGKQEIQDYVDKLPDELKTVGQDASADISSQFDELEQSIDSKQNELIDSLANKYQENLKAVDARIDELKAANQGLVDKAMNAVVGVIKTILKLKNMLTTVLAKIADVVGKIIKDPIGFLGNLISGLMQGFQNFAGNIGTHLQSGLIGWLTGALGPVGIQIPDDLFSLKGIFSLVTQVLGLSWDYVRKKAVKLLGEPVVKGLETAFTPFKILITEGPAGLWEFVKEEFNDLKEMVMDKIREMVITEVIKAGVKWIIGMLNPASAFIKAAMAIYDIVMFFINQGSRILELVNSIIDAVGAIASGAIDGAAKMVEGALAKALPVVIGFMANLLGIGGLAKKVQDLVKRIRKRIDKAIDKLINKAKKMFKGRKPAQGEDPEHAKKVAIGLVAIDKEEKQYMEGGKISRENAEIVAAKVKKNHSIFKSISVIGGDKTWDYKYVASDGIKKGEERNSSDSKNLDREGKLMNGADSKAAVKAMKGFGSKNDVGNKAVLMLTDEKFEQYKVEYISIYAKNKNPGDHFQWPVRYLKQRAARRHGHDAESFWRPIVFPGSEKKMFYIKRNDNSEVNTVPDVLTSSVAGDIKNWGELSNTKNLPDIYLIAQPSEATEVREKNSKGRKLTKERKFELAVRHQSHSKDETKVSGPLKDNISKTGGKIHYAITDHAETIDKFKKNKNWPKK